MHSINDFLTQFIIYRSTSTRCSGNFRLIVDVKELNVQENQETSEREVSVQELSTREQW